MEKQREGFHAALHKLVQKSGGKPNKLNGTELFNTGKQFGYLKEIDGELPLDEIRRFEADMFEVFNKYFSKPMQPPEWVSHSEDPERFDEVTRGNL